ncbi:MAG: proton-conducting transporter membrane subunit [Deinococcales bacterium]
MSPTWLLPLAVAAPFAGAAIAPVLGPRLRARSGLVLWLAFAPALGLLAFVRPALRGAPAEASLAWVPDLGLGFTLRADGFSLLFALMVAVIGVLVTLYAAAYLAPGERHGRFYGYLMTFGGAMLGLVLSDNLIALFAFWELTSIASFLLVGFWDSRAAARDGAVKALLVTAVGGLALMVAVALLGIAGHSATLSGLDLPALRSSPLFAPALALVLVAAFTKSAQLPFHLWLPTAMEAPTPVSAFLHSATMVKAGVFLLAKFAFLLDGTTFAQVAMVAGLLTMFWGSYLALRQNDLKALLAYSTVSQLGILTAMYASGHPLGATAHLVNHAAFKAALFLVVGIVDHATGSRDIRALRGLGRRLPVTAVLAVPAALSMAGVPPFGGFVSKELFYEAMQHEGWLPALIAVTGSVMTFAYSLRFLTVFFGPFRAEAPEIHRPHAAFWLPVLPLTAAVVLFGFVPPQATLATPLTDLAAPGLGFAAKPLALWHGLSTTLALSVLTWLAGIALHLLQGRFARLQAALTPGWNANTVYYALLSGLERFSAGFTRATQGASFATHLRVLFLGAAVAGALQGFRVLLPAVTPVPIDMALATGLVAAGIGGALVTRSRLSALIYLGLAGVASTLIFVLLHAPDLALTQLLVDTVTVILFLSVFRFLPAMRRYSRPPWQTVVDGVIAAGVGATVFTMLLAVQQPVAPRIEGFFLRFSKTLAGGANVVNTILVDFRGYDTMGEIAVLAIAALSVLALLRLQSQQRVEPEPPPEGGQAGGDEAEGEA